VARSAAGGASLIGQTVAKRYRVLSVLGRGGMAVVYAAHDEWDRVEVALKVIRRSPDRVDRFFREVRAAARVQSPFVCPLLDLGTLDEGRSYIVMPLLHGMTLRKLLEQSSPLPLPLALAIADQVLAALEAAHPAGIVHRDLKPENVFLLDASQPHFVKVLDFGIARVAGDKGAPGTATGQAIGTAQYMAPEQARGQKDQDARVDIWCAGVLLYEMLTGARPFDGASYGETLAHVLFDPFKPPRARRPELPEVVEELIVKALQRDRDLRFADARAMRDAMSMLPGAPTLRVETRETLIDDGLGADHPTDPGLPEPFERTIQTPAPERVDDGKTDPIHLPTRAGDEDPD
jgi:eukaryotic-like serine/threonine-protein kinase